MMNYHRLRRDTGMNKRIDSIDILKGITIILVVFGHAVQGIVDSDNLSLNTAFSSIYITKQVIYVSRAT